MIRFGVYLVAKCGYAGVVSVLPFVDESMLLNMGSSFEPEALIESLPSCHKVSKGMTSNAFDTVHLARESIRCSSNLYVTCEKENKKETIFS